MINHNVNRTEKCNILAMSLPIIMGNNTPYSITDIDHLFKILHFLSFHYRTNVKIALTT